MSALVDIGLAVIVILSLLAGLRSGFVDSLFSLASWVVGGLVALRLPRPVLAHLPAGYQRLPGAVILTAVLLFLAAYFVIRFLGSKLAGTSKEGASGLDRLTGALFGLLRGVFLAAAVASFLVGYVPASSRTIRESRALPLLAPVGGVVAGLAPGAVRERMDLGWGRLRSRPHGGPGGPVEA